MRIGRTRAPSLARVVVCLAFAATTAIADDAHRHAGDVLRYAMPAGVFASELWPTPMVVPADLDLRRL